jgi:hypothetical protein
VRWARLLTLTLPSNTPRAEGAEAMHLCSWSALPCSQAGTQRMCQLDRIGLLIDSDRQTAPAPAPWKMLLLSTELPVLSIGTSTKGLWQVVRRAAARCGCCQELLLTVLCACPPACRAALYYRSPLIAPAHPSLTSGWSSTSLVCRSCSWLAPASTKWRMLVEVLGPSCCTATSCLRGHGNAR